MNTKHVNISTYIDDNIKPKMKARKLRQVKHKDESKLSIFKALKLAKSLVKRVKSSDIIRGGKAF